MLMDSSVRERVVSRPHRAFFDTAPARILGLVVLFMAAAGHEARHLYSLSDGDVWCQLRTGLWILQSHAVPHTGLFSQYPELPWIDSSWVYDVLVAVAYRLLGLSAIPVLLMAFEVTLAVMTFRLARGSRENFWSAVVLSAAAQYVLVGLQPDASYFSVLFLGVELILLMKSRRSGSVQPLFWLPLLFALWANLHIQFLYGLAVLGLFLAAALTEEICRRTGLTWFEERVPVTPLGTLGAIVATSLLATLLSPYSYHVYEAVQRSASSSAVYYMPELHAMSFRQPRDYVLLLLAMAGFLALGRRRSRDLFMIALMVISSVVSFGMQRDIWCIALASIAVIGSTLSVAEVAATQERLGRLLVWEKLVTAGLVVVVFVVVAATGIPSGKALLNKVGETFPVRAADYIRDHHLPNPLFNAYQWGSFLTWYLPEYPVAIDGRADLYGDAINIRYLDVMSAKLPLDADPTFAHAHTILLKRESAKAEALSTMPKFTVVYQDSLAVVLLRED